MQKELMRMHSATAKPVTETDTAPTSRRWIIALCIGCWMIAIAFMLLARDELRYPSGDSTSYIDLAFSLRRGEYRALANPYWIPLYPALIYLFLAFIPSLQGSLLLLQATLFTALIASFAFFVT